MVEHPAVNRRVAGSSPARGVIYDHHVIFCLYPAFSFNRENIYRSYNESTT